MEYWGKSKPGSDSISLNALFQYSNIPTGVQTTGKSLSYCMVNVNQRVGNHGVSTFDTISMIPYHWGEHFLVQRSWSNV